jgi:maltose alpha-D-glucosyltransferase / alpha-amylase
VPEIGWGSFTVVETGAAEVLTLRFDWRNNAVLVVHNLAQEPREISFKLKSGNPPQHDLINLLTENHSRANDAGVHQILLEPYGYRWYRVGGLDYLLRRSGT